MREAAPPRRLEPRPPPRHLAPRPPRARRPSGLLFELPVVTIVVVVAMGLLVVALNKHTQSSVAAPFVPNAVENPSPSAPGAAPPSATTLAARPSTSGSGGASSPNLVINAGFESGLDGWQPGGGAHLEVTGAARSGHAALAITAMAGSTADPGVITIDLGTADAQRSYDGTVWVRATTPGTVAEVNLVEYVGGQRLALDGVGVVLTDTNWRQVEVEHFTHMAGSLLAVEVTAPGLRQPAGLFVDDVQVQPRGFGFMWRSGQPVPPTTDTTGMTH
ncbi:MAG TPA: carbohydrate binding domain-containing protein [Actinomycetota bacterium]